MVYIYGTLYSTYEVIKVVTNFFNATQLILQPLVANT